MNFKDEYKKSAENISPDKEAIARMKAAVMAKIEADPEGSADIPEKKKPLPLRRIAYIGGAAAACACITLAAVVLNSRLNSSDNMISGSVSSAASMEMASDENNSSMQITDLPAYDADAPESANGNSLPTSQESSADEADEVAEDASEYDEAVDQSIDETPAYDPVSDGNGFTGDLPENAIATDGNDSDEKSDYSDQVSGDMPTDDISDNGTLPDEVGDGWYDDAEAEGGWYDKAEADIEEDVPDYEECEDEVVTDDCESDYSEEPGNGLSVIVYQLTFDGIDYFPDSNISAIDCPPDCISVVNTADDRDYLIYLDGNVLYLFSGNGAFIGAFTSLIVE